MPLNWPKPLPLVFMVGVPLFLMWAPARALLGAAVSKLPSSKTRLLSSSQSLQRRRRGGSRVTAAKRLSHDSSSAGMGDRGEKVIVIAGAQYYLEFYIRLDHQYLCYLVTSVGWLLSPGFAINVPL